MARLVIAMGGNSGAGGTSLASNAGGSTTDVVALTLDVSDNREGAGGGAGGVAGGGAGGGAGTHKASVACGSTARGVGLSVGVCGNVGGGDTWEASTRNGCAGHGALIVAVCGNGGEGGTEEATAATVSTDAPTPTHIQPSSSSQVGHWSRLL